MATSEPLATLVAQLKERRAQTFQERIKSLDIRDEIWRKCKSLRLRSVPEWIRPVSVDIEQNKGSSFDAISAQRTGLAPDMCCERERLTREFQRLCKSYEYDPDTRAVRHQCSICIHRLLLAVESFVDGHRICSSIGRSGTAILFGSFAHSLVYHLQAMPSPYDLRSGPVLLHTMNYLITNIMDKFDQEREQGDWYNFLWDRLRAIRKVRQWLP